MSFDRTVSVHGFAPTEKHQKGEAVRVEVAAPCATPLDDELLIEFQVRDAKFWLPWRNLKAVVHFFESFE